MNDFIEYRLNSATEINIAEHLSGCDNDFVPKLSERTDINDYAHKIISKAVRFEAWSGDMLLGLVAAYFNDQERHIVYVTSVSVLKKAAGNGIGTYLMRQCIQYAKELGMVQIRLEVACNNLPAIKLYEKSGFVAGRVNAPFVTMDLYLKSGEEYEQST